MAESLISDIYNTIRNKLLDEGNLLLGVPEEACKIEKTLKSIEGVLPSAEKKEVTDDAVKLWVRDLKDVAYDIQDVLDDWSIAQMQMQDESAGKVCCSCIPIPCFGLEQVQYRHYIAHDIKAINERLDAIAKRKNDYGFDKSIVGVKERDEKESTPFVVTYNLPSQEKTKATVIEKLVRDDFKGIIMSHNHIPIVSLVGMGGIGKTTLATMVHDDKNVKAHFSKIIWVCVSDNFSQIKVAKAIAGELKLKLTDPQNLTSVLSEIADSIKENDTFLLILDDVWENSVGKWKNILGCMGKGDAHKSRILLTTRSSDLAMKMEAVFTLDVGELSEEDSWSLFSQCAFSRKAEEDWRIVKDTAKELAKKCKGLPLALEFLGRFMSTKEIKNLVWEEVLTSKMWETRFKEAVFPSLALSYLDLSSTVKRCFTFCSIFPKDTVMKKSRLIHLWMAQGYLQRSTTDPMEVGGGEYFECLVRRSFFRVTGVDHEGDTTVTMHDLVHEFAQDISDGEVAILDPSLKVHPGHNRPEPRHLAYGGEIGESMSLSVSFNLKVLRTLFLSTHPTTILKELCSDKSYLRALGIHFSSDPETSCALKDVKRLVHLRYLCLNLRDLIVLPEEVCDLRYLQTLDLKGCNRLKKLPAEIGRLTDLRHLLFDSEGELDSLPKGLGKLSSLQTLSCFYHNNVDSENFCSLEDLREFKNLRGNLWIKNLSQVAHVDAATRAELHLKKPIVRLTLEFGDGEALPQSKVLEALKPAENYLEYLMIGDYRGVRCPGWIGQLQCLEEIQLKQVSVERLPALGILRKLQKLKIESAHKLKYVGDEFLGISDPNEVFFCSLTELTFEDLPLWKIWEGPKQIIMPSLRKLTLRHCRKLGVLPHFIEYVPNLEILEAMQVGLPLVDLVEDDCPRKLRIGDVVLPRTLKYIKVDPVDDEYCIFDEKRNGVDQPEDSGVMVQQQQLLKFNYVLIHGSKKVHDLVRRSVALTRVKEIHLIYVHDEFLPPLGLMPFLENLQISEAVQVKKVGDEFLGIGNYDELKGGDRGRAFIAFPRLKNLCLSFFFRWEEWEGPHVEVADDQINIMPLLCELKIDAPRLWSLPRFLEDVPLQKLDIGSFYSHRDIVKMPRIRHMEDEACKKKSTMLAQNLQEMDLKNIINAWVPWVPDWGNYCVNLKVLKLYKCSEESLLGLGTFLSLEELTVRSVTRIGGDTPPKRQSQQSLSSSRNTCEVSFPSLRILTFDDMDSWEVLLRESDGTNCAIKIMPRLHELFIRNCYEMKALPRFLQNVRLRRLHISDCLYLEIWWEKEAGEDWLNWKSDISEVKISNRFTALNSDLNCY